MLCSCVAAHVLLGRCLAARVLVDRNIVHVGSAGVCPAGRACWAGVLLFACVAQVSCCCFAAHVFGTGVLQHTLTGHVSCCARCVGRCCPARLSCAGVLLRCSLRSGPAARVSGAGVLLRAFREQLSCCAGFRGQVSCCARFHGQPSCYTPVGCQGARLGAFRGQASCCTRV